MTTVAGDITTDAVRAALLQACPSPDILVNNAGGPPPGDFREWDRDVWLRALDANMLTPIFLIKATVDGMIARRFGRIVNITSVSVKSPIDILGLSNGARAGLTGFIAGLSRKTVAHNVTINNILPGPFDTDRFAPPSRRSRSRPGDQSRRSPGSVRPRTRPDASAPRPSSARCARSSAAPRPATSPGRISCSTAAPTPAPCSGRRGCRRPARGAGAPTAAKGEPLHAREG